MKQVPVGVSGRHIHLSPAHIDMLFGENYELHRLRELSQPGQFAAEETVSLRGPAGQFEQVRILGPARKKTQIEISRTDSFILGVRPPVRESGNHEGTPGITIVGPKAAITVEQGLIIAFRHIHLHTDQAAKWGISDKQMLTVRVDGERSLIFQNVQARVSDYFALAMHIDTDEANAAGLRTGDTAEIIG